MSEFELVTLRNRLARGTRNKAERGELFSAVPVGYFKQSSEDVIQDPDEQSRSMIQLVFEKFAELRSAYAVFRYFAVNDLRLGFRRLRGERIGDLEWRAPSAPRILAILRHPIYAGAYRMLKSYVVKAPSARYVREVQIPSLRRRHRH